MAYLYFDSAATAPPVKEALEAAERAYIEYGNPSSLHGAGLAAKGMVDTARIQVASALRCQPERITFVSCGTEANNQAVFGLAKTRGKRAKKIITTDSEHPSVAEPMKALEKEGFTVVRLSTKGGVLVDLGGNDTNNGVLLEAHLDTLGAVVAEIKGNGRLKLTSLGGMNPNNAEAENVRVYTREECGR